MKRMIQSTFTGTFEIEAVLIKLNTTKRETFSTFDEVLFFRGRTHCPLNNTTYM